MAKEIVICDTNIIIDFYKQDPKVLANLKIIGQRNIAVSVVTADELMHGALNKKELDHIRKDMAHLLLLHFSEPAGKVFLELMNSYALSHRLSVPDGLIAATALTEDLPLYTHNLKDFRYIAGLELHKEI